jgi:hypothetical protein
MRYLALSTLSEVDACEYPDSRKVLIITGQRADGGTPQDVLRREPRLPRALHQTGL